MTTYGSDKIRTAPIGRFGTAQDHNPPPQRHPSIGRTGFSRASIRIDFTQLGVLFVLVDLLQFSVAGYEEAFMIGSYHFYFIDFATMLLGAAVIQNIHKFQKPSLFTGVALLLVAVEFLALLRGTTVNIFQAFYAYRYIIQLPIFCALFLVLRPDGKLIERCTPLFALGCSALIVMFYARVLISPTLFHTAAFDASTLFLNHFRGIDAANAMLLGNCGVLFAHAATTRTKAQRSKLYGILATLALVAVLISRQRTATLATAAAFLVYVVAEPRFIGRLPVWIRVLAVGSLILIVLSFAFGLSAGAYYALLPNQFQGSIQDTGTFDVRQEFWVAAWREFEARPLIAQVFGWYAGHGQILILSTGEAWKFSLHNQYIQMLYNFGLLGQVCFFVIATIGSGSAISAARRKSKPNAGGVSPALAVAWLVGMAIFGVSYEWTGGLAFFPILACCGLGGDQVGRRLVQRAKALLPRPKHPSAAEG